MYRAQSQNNSKQNNLAFLIFPLTLLFMAILLSSLVYADGLSEDEHEKSIETVLQEIRWKYGMRRDEVINPRKVSDADLEELGEAVMNVIFPDPQQHEIMDEMMGGEGSRSLARMHRRMGYNYLSGRGYGMMGGMIGGGRGSMMRSNNHSYDGRMM
jgi:hypothetical protein